VLRLSLRARACVVRYMFNNCGERLQAPSVKLVQLSNNLQTVWDTPVIFLGGRGKRNTTVNPSCCQNMFSRPRQIFCGFVALLLAKAHSTTWHDRKKARSDKRSSCWAISLWHGELMFNKYVKRREASRLLLHHKLTTVALGKMASQEPSSMANIAYWPSS
jgi:hypothetical protein